VGHFSASVFDGETKLLAPFAGGVSPGSLSRFDIVKKKIVQAGTDTRITPQQDTVLIKLLDLAFSGTVLPM